MKITLEQNVFDAAIERIEWLFDEFPHVVVSFSGGKDSTATLEMALIVARQKKRLPLKVCFLDQEAEWQGVADYVQRVMQRSEVDPFWFQTPLFLPNSVSSESRFLMAWEPDGQWMRDKNEIALKDNYEFIDINEEDPKTGYWYRYFGRALEIMVESEPCAFLSGVRAEESPNRRAGLTTNATYKHITYGKVQNKQNNQYTFYPLYDWSYTDIWKSIHSNEWDYCKVYDEFYRYGIAPMKMRISNLHHETAVDQLFYLQEIEPQTWDALQRRLSGINQARQFTRSEMFKVKELPYMFRDWKEYRDYLIDNLLAEKYRYSFKSKFQDMDNKFKHMDKIEEMYKEQVFSVLSNDYEFVKISNFLGRPQTINFLKFMRGKKIDWTRPERDLKYIKKAYRGRQVNVAG